MTRSGGPASPARLRRLEPTLRRALRGPCRLPAGSTLLVAESGGADSTALLVALASLAPEFGLKLHAAHLHHGLRGREADADLRFVTELCGRLRVPLKAARWDCAARMRRRGLSGEGGLRTLRREWLTQVARAMRADAIATAHTADDQLETLLMRLARGTGLTGAAGMRARRGAWIKPLLGATRAEIEADLCAHGLTWREDSSNAGSRHLRNRIRHVAVPALLDALGIAAAAPAARRAGLARRAGALAEELAQADRVLSRAAARALERAWRPDRGRRALDAGMVAKLPRPIRILSIRRSWRLAAGHQAPGLTSGHMTAIESVIRTGAIGMNARASVALPGGWELRAEQGLLRFAPPERVVSASRHASRRVGSPDARLHGGRSRSRRGSPSGRMSPRRPSRATA